MLTDCEKIDLMEAITDLTHSRQKFKAIIADMANEPGKLRGHIKEIESYLELAEDHGKVVMQAL